MLNHFKVYNVLFNGLALLIVAAGVIMGPLFENSILVACLAAAGTLFKGRNNFKKVQFQSGHESLCNMPMQIKSMLSVKWC